MEDDAKYINVETNSNDPKLSCRIPKKLRETIDYAAKRSGRKVGAEIILRLTKSFTENELISEVPKK